MSDPEAGAPPKEPPNVAISHAEAKRVLAIAAHLNQIFRTALDGSKIRAPTQMDHAELVLASASLRALFFDDTPKPLLLGFLDTHELDIKIEAVETNLGLVFLSQLVAEGHVSDLIGGALLNVDEHVNLPLDQETELLMFFEDWAGLEGIRERPELWVPTRSQDEQINSGLTHLTNVGPSQMLTMCRRRVSLKDWGGLRVGFLKAKRIDRRNLISYVANKLGGVHYDSNRSPRDPADIEQFTTLAAAYDWNDQSLIHAGFVAVALACIEVVNTPELVALRSDLKNFYGRRQSYITQKAMKALNEGRVSTPTAK